MYGSKTFVVIIFFLAARHGLAQEEMNSANVDSKSYELFTGKRWDELILFGRGALNAGIDYFYLRLRLGIAYYETGQYRVAVIHFQKAHSFNSVDPLAQEYLYYSLLFSDRFDEARKLSEEFEDQLQIKVNKQAWSPINYVSMEVGAKVSSRSDLFNPALYLQAGLGHAVKNQFSLYHALTLYNQNEYRGKIAQAQYFIQAAIPLKNNWTLTPSMHIVHLNFEGTTERIQGAYFVGSISLTKSYSHLDISIGGTVSNIYDQTQYVQQSRLAIYPLGKPNFSLGTIGYIHTNNSFSPVTFAVNPFITWNPSERLKFSANYFVNINENIVELNGYLVNNSPDLTRSRTSVLASFRLSKHWDLYYVYQLENKQDSNSLQYSYNVLLVGIKFKPQ